MNTAPEFLGFANELSLAADGWAQLAPFGDFPGQAVLANEAGVLATFPAVQRLDRQAAEQMRAQFYSLGNRIKRFFRGCCVYLGHPDMPGSGDRYPDAAEKGLIADLQVRPDGLSCRPVFNAAGAALLNGREKLFFSGRWTSDELPAENGRRIFRPATLLSAGLTPHPNLPVQHLNDKPHPHQPSVPTLMNRQAILELLAAHGFQFANDAAEPALLAALRELGVRAAAAQALTREKTDLEQSVATLTAERDAARAGFANERAARVTSLLDDAITSGRITAAQRPDWQRRLGQDATFANEAAALARLTPVLKTQSLLTGAGDRKFEIANASQRAEAVQALVKLEMERSQCDYSTAFARVQRDHPALFDAMRQPRLD